MASGRGYGLNDFAAVPDAGPSGLHITRPSSQEFGWQPPEVRFRVYKFKAILGF